MNELIATNSELTIEEAIAYEGPDKIVHFEEYLEEKRKVAKALKTFKSGFSALDAATGGLSTGEVIVITGHRKEGKTTFAESWLRAIMQRDPSAKAVIFSYEMPPTDLLKKWEEEKGIPVYLPMDLKGGNFDWLRDRCVEAKYKYMAQIVMIDHLGFVVDMATKNNYSMNIGAFMRRLKLDIALRHNLIVLLIAHQSQPKEDREPSVDSIYGSVTIGQDSDATITVMRRENLNSVEMKDFIIKYGEEKAARVSPPVLADLDDKASAKLSVLKIDCHRKTGVWKWKKMFRKVGDWMEEV